ncbi:MAG TPA: hypothetical protein VL404_08575, partial [Candidatus Eisenbacteria bacterium]|nr:hypothetical protein [Candidatus Eisenbacteria bacterium]
CLTNSIFIETTLSAAQLREFLLKVSKDPKARFFICEVKTIPLNDGWLPMPAWDFINKYAKP